jgi:hypothetical protein
MDTIAFALLSAAVVGLIIWRGVALYNHTFHRKDL